MCLIKKNWIQYLPKSHITECKTMKKHEDAKKKEKRFQIYTAQDDLACLLRKPVSEDENRGRDVKKLFQKYIAQNYLTGLLKQSILQDRSNRGVPVPGTDACFSRQVGWYDQGQDGFGEASCEFVLIL